MQTDTIKIGISACLAGEKVRFDTGHKKSNFCMDELGKHVEYTRFCPEVAVGLPIPRPTIPSTRRRYNKSMSPRWHWRCWA